MTGKALFRNCWKTKWPCSIPWCGGPTYSPVPGSLCHCRQFLGYRWKESRGGTQCHSYVRVGKAVCITILFSLKKPEIESLNWIFSCLLWDSSPFLTLSHQQTQWEMLATTSVSPYQGLNFCSHFRHMTRTTWWWGWTLPSHSIENIGKQQNENSVSREETCYFNRTETDQFTNESPDPLGPHSWPGCFQPIQCLTKHPVIRTSDPNEPPQHLAKWATIDDVGKNPASPAGENRQ